jgi:hypothetical protein
MNALQEMADSALAHARDFHTYDHRVDELFEIAAHTTKRTIAPRAAMSGLAAMIDHDAEVQRVAQVGAPELADELVDRQVFEAVSLERERLAPGKMETVAMRTDDIDGFEEILLGARRYIYVEGAAVGLEAFLSSQHPEAVVDRRDGLTRVDLMAESYRVHPHEVVEDTPAS